MSDLRLPPWVSEVVGDVEDTETATRHPQNRRVAVDENWLSYHNPTKLESLCDMIITTETIARERGAVGCTKCYGGNGMYDFEYTTDGVGV